jgi:hypothetical protein
MRKFTKSLLALALLFVGVGGVNSKTLSVNLSALPASSENTTWAWDAGTSTGTFAWTGTSYNSTELFSIGNYSAYTTLKLVTKEGTANHFRIIIKFTNGASQVTINPVATGTVSVNLLEHTTVENLAKVQTIRLSGANDATGDISVSRIYLEGPDINYIEEKTIQVIPTGAVDLNGITGTGSAWAINYPITCADGTLFGSSTIDSDEKSANIADYDYLLFNVTEASADAQINLRVFVSTAQSSNNDTRVCLYPHPIADYGTVEDWTQPTTITAPGIYVAKISGYPLLRGVKNRAYWQGDAGSIKIGLAYVGSGSPVAPVDKVVRAGEETLTDPTATCFDVTKLEGTGLTFNATNPNALFIAKAGQLTNTKNVIVDGVCANLELTDGNYPFKAPANFTATKVSYNRSFVDGKTATVCLPFELTEDELDEVVGSFYELKDIAALSDDFTFSLVSAGTTAYRPYVFDPEYNGALLTGFTNKVIPATPETLTGATFGGYTMTGVLTGSSDVAADNPGKTVYGWSGNDGNEGVLVKVGTGVAINPFRAYVVYDGDAPSPEMLYVHFDNGSVTGINEVSETKKALNRDGKYIKNGKIMIVKNGVKYNAVGAQVK